MITLILMFVVMIAYGVVIYRDVKSIPPSKEKSKNNRDYYPPGLL